MNFTDEEIKACSATKGDLLVCEGGAGYGRSAIWPYDYDICLQNHVHRLRPYIDGICEYVYYFIYLLKESNQLASVGTAMPGLSANRLKGLLLPLPPQREQKHIVDMLTKVIPFVERYDNIEKNLSQLNADLPLLIKKSILQEAIQGKLVQQDPNDEPASVLLQRIKEEKLRLVKEGKLKKKDVVESFIYKGDDNKYYEQIGKTVTDITNEIPFELPQGWEWTRLSVVSDIYTGNSISEKEKRTKYTGVAGRYYIGTKDVGFDNNIRYNNGVAIPKEYENNFRVAPDNSVLMCIEGGSAGRKIAVLNQDVCFGNKLCCFGPFVNITRYIFYYLQSPLFLDMFNDNKTGIIGGVSIAKVKKIPIPLPPYREIERIVNKVNKSYICI
jgi:type I restriction enzyme S subunit